MPTDPPSLAVLEQAARDALTVTNHVVGPARQSDESRIALRTACFTEVLRARLAYEYGPGER